jgi:hypothetical protein
VPTGRTEDMTARGYGRLTRTAKESRNSGGLLVETPVTTMVVVGSQARCRLLFCFLRILKMCFADLVKQLRAAGVSATESQIRWAITCGHVSRPGRDGSLRFAFSEANLAELIDYFRSRESTVV